MNKKAASGTLLRLLLIGMLTFAFNIQPVKAEPTALGNTDDLVACWHFDENTGSTAYDSSSNNNDGTIYGATWTSGVTGSALSFDGADDYIEVPSFQNLAFNEVTISVWVKPVSGNINNNRIITIHDGVTPDYHYFDVETTTIRSISVYIDGDEFMDHDRTLNPDIWTHIARAYYH